MANIAMAGQMNNDVRGFLKREIDARVRQLTAGSRGEKRPNARGSASDPAAWLRFASRRQKRNGHTGNCGCPTCRTREEGL
jgi:hypothetical protein